jgi:hypothetical protein
MVGSLGSASCSNGSETEESTESLARELLLGDPEDATLGLLDIENRFQDSVASCMDASGFEYWAPDQSQETEFASEMIAIIDAEVRLPTNRQEAERRGLGIYSALQESKKAGLWDLEPNVPGQARNEAAIEALSPEEERAYAQEKARCEEEALRTVGAPYEELDVVAEVEHAAAQRALASAELSDMVDSWSSCMRASGTLDELETLGYPVSDPTSFLSSAQQHLFSLVERESFEDDLESTRATETTWAVESLDCGGDQVLATRIEQLVESEVEVELEERGL